MFTVRNYKGGSEIERFDFIEKSDTGDYITRLYEDSRSTRKGKVLYNKDDLWLSLWGLYKYIINPFLPDSKFKINSIFFHNFEP